MFFLVSLAGINQEILELDKGMQALKAQITLAEATDADVQVIKDFLDSNKETFEELKSKRQEMENCFKNCVEYFGEDIKTSTPESFFGTFHTFFHQFEKAKKDNERELEIAKRAEEKAAKLLEIEKEKNDKHAAMVNYSFIAERDNFVI